MIEDGAHYSYVLHYFVIDPLIPAEPCKNYEANDSAGKHTSSPKGNDLEGQSVLTPEGYDSWFDVLYIFF